MKVFVLKLSDPNGDARMIRVFSDRKKARQAARRWTRTTGKDASASEWHGGDDREDYSAYLYAVVVE